MMKSPRQAAAIAEKGKHPVQRMSIEPSDNGGFVSHTTPTRPPRKGGGYQPGPEPDTAVHPNVNHLIAHVKATMGQGARPGASKTPSQWGGVANQMLASGVGAPKSSNGGR